MTTARRESVMTHQEQERRHRASSGRAYYGAGGSSSVPSKGKGIAGAMRRAFNTC